MRFLRLRPSARHRFAFLLTLILAAHGARADASEATPEPDRPVPEIGDPCCRIAEDLFQAGFWDEASTEYQRYLFWQPQGDLRQMCLARLTVCWRNLGRFEQALDACLLGLRESDSANLENEYRLEAGGLFLRMNQEAAAASKARQVLNGEALPCHRLRARSLQIRAMMSQYRFEEAQTALDSLLGDMQAVLNPEPADLEAMQLALREVSLKSTDKAESLAKYIPGAGQLYAGQPGKGVNALALNGGLAKLVVDSIGSGDVGAAIFSFYLLRRYYYGNRHNAARSCRDRNLSEIAPIAERILAAAEMIECPGIFVSSAGVVGAAADAAR